MSHRGRSRRPRSDEEIALPPGVDPAAGFWVCHHCKRVPDFTREQEDRIECGVMGLNVAAKCPHCHHNDVWWHEPSPREKARVQPASVSTEKGIALFAALKADLAKQG